MGSKTVLETLEAARKRIEKPDSWTQRHYARNAKGRLASYDGPDAVCWCAEGALFAVGADGNAFRAVEEAIPLPLTIIQFNDSPGRTHAEILRAFDAAIAKEREAQHVL